MKKCFKCGIEKDLNEFYAHPQMPDGRVNKCKECNKKDVKDNYFKNRENPEYIEKERARGREKYERLSYVNRKPNKESRKKHMYNYRQKYPEKYAAKNASQHIEKNNKNNHLHHWSYNKEHYKDVIELTIKHHALAHRFLVYDQERMMYRTINGILLDTKEAHIEYINSLQF